MLQFSIAPPRQWESNVGIGMHINYKPTPEDFFPFNVGLILLQLSSVKIKASPALWRKRSYTARMIFLSSTGM